MVDKTKFMLYDLFTNEESQPKFLRVVPSTDGSRKLFILFEMPNGIEFSITVKADEMDPAIREYTED